MADDMTIRDVHEALLQAIRDLENMDVEVPAALRLAAILAQRHAVDDRRREP
jgi:hypothetical protein